MASENQQQRDVDRATIKVKLIENSILVGCGPEGWFSFLKWDGKGGASEHIAARLERLVKERAEAAP